VAQLERVISFRSILLITINSVMGTGIFFLPAIGALATGTASFWAWIIMGLFAMYLAMIFAELVGMYPQSGGVYEFCKRAFNHEVSFFVGFTTIIVGYITIAMLIVGAVSYLIPTAPIWMTTGTALTLVLMFHSVAYRGMDASVSMLVMFAIITLSIVVLLIIASIFNFQIANLADIFVVCRTENCMATPMILATVFLIAQTYFGWETTAFLAGEAKDGAHAVPKAIIIGTALILIISWSLVLLSFAAVGADAVGAHAETSLAFLGTTFFGEQWAQIFTLWAYLAIIGSVAGWIVSAPRLISSMAEDKLFISQLCQIHPRFKTPSKAIIFQCIIITLLIIFSASSFENLLYLLMPLILVQYSVVAIALVVLRYREPDLPRTFKIPGPNWLSLLVIPIFAGLTYMWAINTPGATQMLIQGTTLVALGIPVLLLLKAYYDPDFIIKLNDFFAWFVYLTERISLPQGVRKEILLLVGNIHGKRVLEYGCSVGTLTVQIAERVSRTGKIYATNISRKELEISRTRVLRRGHDHVVFIHDSHQVNRIHPHIPQVDLVLSFGMLSHIQDLKKVLKEMNKCLVQGGKICMVDYTNYFHVIPDVEWISSDAQIKDIFKSCGFSVTVTRKKGRFWNYVYIHGFKASTGQTDVLYV